MNLLRRFYLGLLLLVPSLGYSQCANQITVSYYVNGTLTSQNINNGQSGTSASICPTAGAQYAFNASSSSNAVLTLARVLTQGATPAADVVQTLNSATLTAGTALNSSVTLTASTLFRVESKTTDTNCNKDGFVYLTLAPTLAVTANVTSVCVGGTATLTASGASSGAYTWMANGNTIAGQTGSTLTVNPTTTTTYTVSATTSCGTSSQQLTVPVKDVTIAPSAPTVCASQSTTLAASYSGASATYQWTAAGSTTVLSTSASLTVAPPTTTTYQVVATTTDCNTITKQITVTVGTPTAAISPSAAAISTGCSATLTATSNNSGATFAWSPSTGLSTTTGATVTASPTATTTYTVTATTTCGTTTSQVTVAVVTPAYSVTPASAATCAGGNATFAASTNVTGATYAWYKTTDNGTILSTNPTLTVAPTANTSYRVVTTVPCTTTTNTQTVSVTVGSGTAPTVSATTPNSTIARGGATTLTASGASTYAWSPATGLSATSGATVTANPTTTTTYTVTGTAANACTNTSQVTITVTQPLPVTLVSFEATWAAGGPVLTWATALEENNAYFEVERSLDGTEFETLSRRAGAGTSTSRHSYQFTDETLPTGAGPVYYRLRQVDDSGEAAYSAVRTVQLPTLVGALKAVAFPNPYESSTTVRFEASGTGPAVITLRNVLGQVVLTQRLATATGPQEVKLTPASPLPGGLYYLTVRQGSQQQVVQLSHR